MIDLFKASASRTKNYVNRSAVLLSGMTGTKKTLVDLVMRFSGQQLTVFDDMEAAKDWLVK